MTLRYSNGGFALHCKSQLRDRVRRLPRRYTLQTLFRFPDASTHDLWPRPRFWSEIPPELATEMTDTVQSP